MVMEPSHPTPVQAQEKIQVVVAAKAAKKAYAPNAPIANLKSKNDQMTYLLEATLMIERSLDNLIKNQESLKRIVDTKIHDLDVKITEVQTIVEKLRDDVEIARAVACDSGDDRLTIERF